jgi:formate dehydrogenase (NADP+) alpha subunit
LATITLAINGKPITCPSGTSVLQAARRNGIRIPTLCHHDDLAPHGACRLCLVEDERTGRLLAACVTPAARDASLLTHSPQVLRHRRNIVRLMMAEHPESCIVCDKGNRCRLRGIAAELGIGDNGLYPMPNYKPLEQANPFIARDLSKCILCGKCIRADHELVVVGAIDYNLRGFRSRPSTLHDEALEHSQCTFCGTCVSMCPTAALSPAAGRFKGTPERETLSICGFCPVGCTLSMGIAGDRVVEVNPADQPETVNRATLCVRGHFAHDYLDSTSRLTQPLIRRNGTLAPASWDEALDTMAERLMAAKREHGQGSLAFWGSSKCTNEENYLFQKIARTLLGTPNIDNNGHVDGRDHCQWIDARTGGGYRAMPLADLAAAGAILMVGADPGRTLPVMSYHIKRAVRKGTPLITIGTAPTELDRYARLSIRVPPDRHVASILALCARMIRIGAVDADFISQGTQGFEDFRREIASYDTDATGRGSGISEEMVAAAAELLKGGPITAVAGHEVIHHASGMACVDAMLDLLLMTGSLGRPGAGFYLEIRDNNLIGAWDMGSAPDALPGRTPLGDADGRKQWEKAWGCRISPDPGLNMVQVIEAAEIGQIKSLFILGENPLRALPDPDRVRKALSRIDFIAVQEIVHTETVDMAHVVLPGASFAEKAGSFTNLEGRIQAFAPAAPPPGQARPDLEILAELAARLAGVTHRPSLEEIRNEIRRHVPLYADLVPSIGQAWLRADTGKRRDPPAFTPVDAAAQAPAGEASFPFTAVLAPTRLHAGSGTRTSRSPRIQRMGSHGSVRISPADCRQLGLEACSRVRLTSPHGTLEREMVTDADLAPGTLIVPLGFNDNDAMRLVTLLASDRKDAGQPVFVSTCPVQVGKTT